MIGEKSTGGYYVGNTEGEARPLSQIDNSMDRLLNLASEVEHLIGALESRLSPILMPEQPTPEEGKNGSPKVLTQLASRIESQIDINSSSINKLHSILTRLDI